MLDSDETEDALSESERNRGAQEWLAEAARVIEGALRSGVSPQELRSLLEGSISEHDTASSDSLPEFPAEDPDTVYTELPAGLIDVPSAVRKYKLRSSTVYDWIKKGHLNLHGRLKGPVRGGGFLVIRETELVTYMAAPRGKGGRPRKVPPE